MRIHEYTLFNVDQDMLFNIGNTVLSRRLISTKLTLFRKRLLQSTILSSVDYPCRFGVRSDPDGLFSWTEELKSKVIGVRDLLGAWHSSDTHPLSSHTLTRLILHLNKS